MTATRWNTLIALSTPSVAEIRAKCKTWIQLRADVKNMIYIGDNLVLMCPRGESIEGRALNLICISRPQIYAGTNLSPGVHFALFTTGKILKTPLYESALGFIESLKN